ncbi:phosphate ABC transporter substrate-binding protein [Izhakiella australiensis]|uniref:Phosphate-binding protein n=1 Tax=Izhakiella australiensis TaxID=1926881 RepID=A0A1S8YGQ7_9GAMM|nr:PstS family phosphate ABC transporter substrate-binding protein [Izhakiella australiensis]OON38047.1 phosphate ABC transporter substrate-binding protein [Izhakiella australiensis]
MKKLAFVILLLLSAGAVAAEQPLVGNLTSVGSDTLGGLMSLWAENFNRQHPGVNVQVQAAGSSTAPTALAAGAAQIGAMSRPMQASERQLFIDRFGYAPLAIPVATDALMVMVNQDNPLRGLRLRQLDALFSITRRCGPGPVPVTWQDLGVTQPGWAALRIQRFGRNSASGTWGFFKHRVLCQGDFRNDVAEFPGSSAVVQAVANTRNAIGYASIGFQASGVRMLPLSYNGADWIAPDEANIRSGRYPLTRQLYLYVNKAPGQPPDPLTRAFLQQILSPEGQALVRQSGYLPLSEMQRRQALKEIEGQGSAASFSRR